MENILLVEPNYNNKYPPIGLMKLSTYHKNKGDYVVFKKGIAPEEICEGVDRVYITTMFSFHYDLTCETINHYVEQVGEDKVYLGGVAAMLDIERFKEDTGLTNIIKGQLTDSAMIGYDDGTNIDSLALDYDILDDDKYEYAMVDCFYAYTTRGCLRNCKFCSVTELEPEFIDTYEHIQDQIKTVRELHGDKRTLVLMDNNILFSDNLGEIVDSIRNLGFKSQEAAFVPPNPVKNCIKQLHRRLENNLSLDPFMGKAIDVIERFTIKIRSKELRSKYEGFLSDIESQPTSESKAAKILEYEETLLEITPKYLRKKPMQSFVDFNQGIDVRLINDDNMKELARLPIRPFRLTFDDLDLQYEYINAFETAYRHGLRHISSYMLYNFEDTPEQFWERARINVRLFNKYPDVTAFMFPMKYVPVEIQDRKFIGEHWNKKYLDAINVILNVTNGIITKGEDFFLRGYGHSVDDFKAILSMPTELIKFRDIYEKNGIIDAWRKIFDSMTLEEREQLIREHISGALKRSNHPIARYYKITQKKIKDGKIKVEDYL